MKNEKINLLDVVPYISEHITTKKEKELSVITFPRFKNRFMQKYLVPRNKSAEAHISLDEQGTRVWDLIDGKRTVEEITKLLAGYFQNEQEYESRILTFIVQLQKSGFIKYKMKV